MRSPLNIDPLIAVHNYCKDYHGNFFSILGDDDFYADTNVLFSIRSTFEKTSVSTCIGSTKKIFIKSNGEINEHLSNPATGDSHSYTFISTFDILNKQFHDWKLKASYYTSDIISTSSNLHHPLLKDFNFHSSATFFRVSSLLKISLSIANLFTPPFGDIGFLKALSWHDTHALFTSMVAYIGVMEARETLMIQNPNKNKRTNYYLASSINHPRALDIPVFFIIASNQFIRECMTLPYITKISRTVAFRLSASNHIVKARFSFRYTILYLFRLWAPLSNLARSSNEN
jgi:hypothetical protein